VRYSAPPGYHNPADQAGTAAWRDQPHSEIAQDAPRLAATDDQAHF
jgi:hypothetical protein